MISEVLTQFSVESVSSKNESSENDNNWYSEDNVDDTEEGFRLLGMPCVYRS